MPEEELIQPEPQNADGTAHFTYFDYLTQLSFIWDGHSEFIEVSRGGYGEPVMDKYHPESLSLQIKANSRNWMHWYAGVCQLYVESWKEIQR